MLNCPMFNIGLSKVVAAVGLVLAAAWRWGHLALYLYQFLTVRSYTGRFAADPANNVWRALAERVASDPHRVALRFEGRSWSFSELRDEANRVASWARRRGLRPVESCVALLLESRPQLVFNIYGLAKEGVPAALINPQTRGDSLLHCLEACGCSVLLVGAELLPVIQQVQGRLPPGLEVWVQAERDGIAAAAAVDPVFPGGGAGDFRRFDAECVLHEAAAAAAGTRPQNVARPQPSSLLLYIFTSGTTGFPKAAKISHVRFYMAGVSFAMFNGIRAADTVYCPLPLYHSSACMIGLSMMTFAGCCLVLRRRFSASACMRECAQEGCSVLLYIGELCRYLLRSPASEWDRRHSLRKAIGNGLRPEVWRPFQLRFGIPYIGEFYGSTEGNANLVNNQNRPGACGYIPWVARFFYPVKLARLDPERDWELLRDAEGRCIECAPGEPGELLALINDRQPLRRFDGYLEAAANHTKVARDCFRPGDRWFRTGDLLRRDADGFVFFVDRIGDTFRWKGENVSTAEVERVLLGGFRLAGQPQELRFESACVFGVGVPGFDGKAGMAAVVPEAAWGRAGYPAICGALQNPEFAEALRAQLPEFALPRFLRLVPEVALTHTFKQRKVELADLGFAPRPVYLEESAARNPAAVDVFVLQRRGPLISYVPLSEECLASLPNTIF